MNRSIARQVTPGQFFPLIIAPVGACLGIWFAREQWFYSFALLFCVAIAIWPVEATLGIYALLLPFDSITKLGTSPGGRTVTFYLGALATVVLLGLGLLDDRLHLPSRTSRCWLALGCWGVMTIFWALDEDALLMQVPTILGLLALYMVAASFEISEQQLARLSLLTVAGGLAASLFSIHNFASGIWTVEGRSSLILGTQQADPNVFAAALMVPLALTMAELLSRKGILLKGMMFTISVVITSAILLTMSRGAVLGLLAMAAVYAWRFQLKRWVLVLVAIAGSLVLLLPVLFLSRFKEALSTGGAGRLDIWIAGLSALRHFFIQGAGLGNFEVAYQQYAGFAPVFRGYSRAAHNIYLQIAVELGVAGLAIFVCGVARHLGDLRSLSSNVPRPEPKAVACEAMTAAMGVSAFFVGLLWHKSFWMVLIFGSLVVRAMRTRYSYATYKG